jgi:phytoene/squalene synthetase
VSEQESWDFPNQAIPEGSAGYYVARFSAAEKRGDIARWLAWYAHIDDIAHKATDPGVSRLKLDWWREECDNTLHGRARHPLAQALAPQVKAAWQVAQMLRALQAVEMRILRRQPRNQAEYVERCGDSHGSLARLLGAGERTDLEDVGERLGIYLATVQHLQRLGSDAIADHVMLPADHLARHAVALEDLRTGTTIPGLATMADELLAQHRVEDTRHLRRHTVLQPALRLAAQAQRLERKLRRHGFASHQRRLELTPLGLLWSAWRIR